MGFTTNTSGKISTKNSNLSISVPGYNLYEGYIVSATKTTITFSSELSDADDFYNGKIIEITEGIGRGTFRKIQDYDGSTRTITVLPFGDIPNSETSCVIHRNSGVVPIQNQSGYHYNINLDSTASSVDDFYNIAIMQLIKTNGDRFTNYIKTYNGTSKQAIMSKRWEKIPKQGDFYIIVGESGTATAGTSTTITLDANKSDGIKVGMLIGIYHGTGSVEVNTINDITDSVVTVDGDWDTVPDTSSKYVIYCGWIGEYEDVSNYSKIAYALKIKGSERMSVIGSMSPNLSDASAENSITEMIYDTSSTHTLSATAKYFRILLTGLGTSITGSVQTTLGFVQGKVTKSVSDTVTDSSDCNIVRAVITGKSEDDGNYKNINTDYEGNLNVNLMQPRDSFGHIVTAEPRVMSELKFPYATTHYLQEFFFKGSAGFLHSNGILTPITGPTTNSVARLSGIHRNYDAGGLSMVIRFSAFFSEPAEGCEQIIGYGDQNNGYFVGYTGTDFGVLQRNGGKSEIRLLQILTGSTATGNVVVELDGSTVNVPVTAGDSKYEVARKLASGVLAAPYYLQNEYAGLGPGWRSTEDNSKVLFHAEDSGPHSGSYSVSGQGVTGVFVQYQAGVSCVDTWYTQEMWNVDRLDETVALPVIDFKKGNMFEIDQQWLGFGNIFFKIQNPISGRFCHIHNIKYGNQHTISSIEVPHQPLMMEVNNGNTTNSVSLSSASMVSMTLGINNIYNATRFGSSVIKRQTLKSGVRYNILTLRNNTVLMGTTNVIEMLGLTIASSWKGGASAIFHTVVNGTLDHSLTTSITEQGTGYSVTKAVTTTGGSGTGMTIDITSVGGSGEITGAIIRNYGSGYLKNDVVTLSGAGSETATVTLETEGLTWEPRKANVSCADICKNNVRVTGGEDHFSISMDPNTRFFESFNDMEIFMPPWYTLTLAMEPLDDEIDSEFSCSFFWSEKI